MPRFPNIRGSMLPFLQRETRRFDPQHGYTYEAEFKGLAYDAMQALEQDFIAQGIACVFVFERDVCYLNAVDSTQQYTIDTWQIVGNEERFDIFSHPTMLSVLTPQGIGALREDLDNNKKLSELITDLGTAGFSPGDAATIGRFYSLAQRGSTEYRRGQYVLKHTTNAAGRGYADNVSDVGVDAIYNTAQLLTETRSGIWSFPLPDRLYTKINAIPAPTPQTNYSWGWLKSSSTETTVANNRIEIGTDYTLELWSIDLYALSTLKV